MYWIYCLISFHCNQVFIGWVKGIPVYSSVHFYEGFVLMFCPGDWNAHILLCKPLNPPTARILKLISCRHFAEPCLCGNSGYLASEMAFWTISFWLKNIFFSYIFKPMQRKQTTEPYKMILSLNYLTTNYCLLISPSRLRRAIALARYRSR